MAALTATAVGVLSYTRRNPRLGAGFALLLALILFWGIGTLLVDTQKAYPLAAMPNRPPSRLYPLGTDSQGRDLLATIISGISLTFRIGFVAGSVGLGIGIILGFLAAFYGGMVDAIIRWIVDVLLTLPGLLVLVVIASAFRGGMTVYGMALVVSSLAWTWPTRTIRSQVLTLRERAFVQMARLSGMNSLEIIVRELIPNLLPYLAADFVGAVASAILASIGLEALGLGPMRSPTLGMTIYWVMYYTAIMRGMWWWWAPPIIIIVLLFIGLFMLAAGLDELANPRVRRTV